MCKCLPSAGARTRAHTHTHTLSLNHSQSQSQSCADTNFRNLHTEEKTRRKCTLSPSCTHEVLAGYAQGTRRIRNATSAYQLGKNSDFQRERKLTHAYGKRYQVQRERQITHAHMQCREDQSALRLHSNFRNVQVKKGV